MGTVHRAKRGVYCMEQQSMSNRDDEDILWHTGLFAHMDSSFPKKCMNCGRVFENAEQYFTETKDINERDKGLKPYTDDSTTTIVEAFRNCPCGSTLMEIFDDHREELQAGIDRSAKQQAITKSVRLDKDADLITPRETRPEVTRIDEPPPVFRSIEDNLGMKFTEMFADDPGPWGNAWHEGLRPSGDDAFPKKCRNCGRIFETPEDFFQETASIKADQTGLKECLDENAQAFVEAYRNCPCGSTLMDHFTNRRDMSAAGQARRDKFDEMLAFLMNAGLDPVTARDELLKVARGGKSKILSKIKPPGEGAAR
jgi:hypothetical protein